MYIFLDIDGVLNKKEQWNKLYSLDKECIKNFCTFINGIKNENTYIILTSSWKDGFISSKNKNNTPQIKQLEQMLSEYGVLIRGKTSAIKSGKRNDEINDFIVSHSVNKYIVIDDDRDLFSKEDKHNYFTDPLNGFTKKDIRGCMKCI